VRSRALLVFLLALPVGAVFPLAQSAPPSALPLPSQTISLPTFTSTASVASVSYTYTLIGHAPAKGGTTTIPTVLVPVALTLDAPMDEAGRKAVLDAGAIAAATGTRCSASRRSSR
jgi:chitinase